MLITSHAPGPLRFLLGVLVSVSCCSCSPTESFQSNDKQIGGAMSNSSEEVPDEVFQKVVLNSEAKYECSPAPPEDIEWRGILINAPKAVECSLENGRVKAKIPICAFYTLEMDREFSTHPFFLVASDIDSGKTYKGSVLEADDGHDIPNPEDRGELNDEELSGAIGGYANPNLTHYVALPAPGTYKVTLERGQRKSNIVEIRIFLNEPLPNP